MQEVLFRRSNFSQSAVVSALWLCALALLGLVVAYWTWVWFGPNQEPRVESVEEQAGRITVARGLFGHARPAQGTVAPTGLAIRLLGVVSATGGRPAYAVVKLDSRRILAVRAGEDIIQGIRLEEVFPDHVILARNGARETLSWPERAKAAPPPIPRIAR